MKALRFDILCSLQTFKWHYRSWAYVSAASVRRFSGQTSLNITKQTKLQTVCGTNCKQSVGERKNEKEPHFSARYDSRCNSYDCRMYIILKSEPQSRYWCSY
jgi:hypothetical protein